MHESFKAFGRSTRQAGYAVADIVKFTDTFFNSSVALHSVQHSREEPHKPKSADRCPLSHHIKTAFTIKSQGTLLPM